MANKGKFTPVAVVKWPGLLESRKISLQKGKEVYGDVEEHNMRGDAYRHLVWQALMAKKYGELPAKGFADWHEAPIPAWLGGAGTDPNMNEVAMDQQNNALGREIARKAKTEEDIYRLAKEYVDSGKARYMGLPEVMENIKLDDASGRNY